MPLPVLGVAQARVFTSTSRFITLIAGRRLGKTTLLVVRAFHRAARKSNAEIRYIAPTYKQGRQIFWGPLKRLVSYEYYQGNTNETDMRMTLLNGSNIMVLGADNPDSLRGPGLDDAMFDEYADQDPKVFDEVIRPALSDHDRDGTAIFVGTPKGYNHFYDLHVLGLDAKEPEWETFTFTTAQGGQVKRSEILKAKHGLDHRVFRQEYEASFETLKGRVYDNFERKRFPQGNVDDTILDLGRTLVVGMDFNVNPMSAVVFQDVRGYPQALDEIELMTSNTEEMAQVLRAKYPNRTIIVCPDASGAAQSSKAPLGQTDLTILKRYGFQIDAERANPQVVDRVNNFQSLLKSGTGKRRFTVHSRCKKLMKCLEGLTWKEGTNLMDKKSGLDHMTDAAGYALWQRWNILAQLLPSSTPSGDGVYSPYEA